MNTRKLLSIIGKVLLSVVSFLIILLVLLLWWGSISHIEVPAAKSSTLTSIPMQEENGVRRLGRNWITEYKPNLYVCYVEGSDYDMGYAFGRLAQRQMVTQESILFDVLIDLESSSFRQSLIRSFVRLFTYGMETYFSQSSLDVLNGLSQSDTFKTDFIEGAYERQLTLHAAHDLGHALQDYNLAGCTTFAADSLRSDSLGMICGRNFDFYVSDDFAKEKVITIWNPEYGNSFITVGWGGMCGVMTGVNDKGLSVVLNASTTDKPDHSGIPVIMLARDILQFCSTLSQTDCLVSQRKTFVSENITVCAKDGMMCIEKSSEKQGLLYPKDNLLCVANHFQSDSMLNSVGNQENIKYGYTKHRLDRLHELLDSCDKIDEKTAVSVLRDVCGVGGEDIGLGNEMAINQLIAHHSAIIRPLRKEIIVSTEPWQCGEFVAFSLDSILKKGTDGLSGLKNRNIMPDTLVNTTRFENYKKYRQYAEFLTENEKVSQTFIDTFLSLNPNYYETYCIAASRTDDVEKKKKLYQKALECKIPKMSIRRKIEESLNKLK